MSVTGPKEKKKRSSRVAATPKAASSAKKGVKGSTDDGGSPQLRRRLLSTARPRPESSPRYNDCKSPGGCSDDDLWHLIWSQVEATPQKKTVKSPEPCLAIEIYDGKRRRIHGKQPPSLAIEVYRKRLYGKQPPPQPNIDMAVRGVRPLRGHYDALGLTRNATAAQIRSAYRQRALSTHPDKGGNPDEFVRVVAAFEELIDSSRRAAYDRTLDMFGRSDGRVSDEDQGKSADSEMPEKEVARADLGAARVAHVRLLSASPGAWAAEFSKLADNTLEALRNFLQGGSMFAAKEDKRSEAQQANDAGQVHSWNGPTCITHHRNGYKVSVTWASLHVCTGFTKSLVQAIDWQIALLWLRGLAEARMKQKGQKISSELLTQEELLQIFELEPAMELTFTVMVRTGGGKGKKVSSPSVQDLQVALDIRRRFLAALNSRSPESKLQQEKSKIEKELVQRRQERKALEKQLLSAASLEIRFRAAGASSGKSHPPPSSDAGGGKKRKRNSETSADPGPKRTKRLAITA
eukprot:TRINITY_DN54223_c0_g1_i1.p1 TRINITY_DN54223_c0_g1~~TRINITY_DN54223_c0_g1_i1.p1  ORF type:complete len:563 (+),score=116.60 TRINITY_DN54223_c0_g1_i1:130-1689(+)